MTQFEKELINAIRNGCPSCESIYFHMIYNRIEYKYPVVEEDNELTLLADRKPEEPKLGLIYCQSCEFPLWENNQWCPELEEIVKGE